MVGKLERVSLREVWPHEARDFTTWLEKNIDVLNEETDLTLSGAEREQEAGSFNVDLLAEDLSGNPVVIENQLEKSDHDHLGKLITYLTVIEAKTAIWIVANPRPEHVSAVSWLNESSSAAFYLLKVEAVRIGDSPPAPLLTLIVGPSEESRDIAGTKIELGERDRLRKEFWTSLLEKARGRTNLHGAASPGTGSGIRTGAGKYGLSFNYVIGQNDSRVELYIDRGKGREQENTAIFDELEASRDAIEEAFGPALEWQRLEGKRACRIKKDIDLGGYRDESKWDEIQESMVDAMIRLEEALRPALEKIKV